MSDQDKSTKIRVRVINTQQIRTKIRVHIINTATEAITTRIWLQQQVQQKNYHDKKIVYKPLVHKHKRFLKL